MDRTPDHKFPWLFLGMAFGFTWLVLLPGVLASQGWFTLPVPMMALVAVAQFGPSLSAFVLVALREGKPGVQRLLGRALNFHIPLPWLAVIFLLPLALAGAALAVNAVLGGKAPDQQLLSQPALILPYFFFIFFLQGPVPEEFGWRGYLLDRLQKRWHPLAASLVLGFIWWLWHLQAHFMQGVAQSYLPQGIYLAWTLAFSILMTWVYNNTGGNLLAALIFHTMANLANAIFPTMELVPGGNQSAYLILAVLTWLVSAGVIIRWGSGNRHPEGSS